MKKIILPIIILCSLLLSFELSAHRLIAGRIAIQKVGLNSLNISLVVYKDCQSGNLCGCPVVLNTGCILPVQIRGGSAGFYGTLFSTLNLTVVPNASTNDVTSRCIGVNKSVCSNCGTTTPGSISPGAEAYTFQGTLNLTNIPDSCCEIVVSYTECCRENNLINLNNGGSQNFYVESRFNRCLNSTSPSFALEPILIGNPGNNFTYNFQAVDADGDSLSYSLSPLQVAMDTNAIYNAPYSANYPFPYSGAPLLYSENQYPNGIHINREFGVMRFKATSTFKSALVLETKEWKNGVQIGSTKTNMMVYSISAWPNQDPLIRMYDSLGTNISNANNRIDTIPVGRKYTRYLGSVDVNADTTNLIFRMIGNPNAAEKVHVNSIKPQFDSMVVNYTPTQQDINGKVKNMMAGVIDQTCVNQGSNHILWGVLVSEIPDVQIQTINTGIRLKKLKYNKLNSAFTYRNQTIWAIEKSPNSNQFDTLQMDSINGFGFIQPGTYKIRLGIKAPWERIWFEETIQINQFKIKLKSKTDVTCAGINNGTVSLQSEGGFAPFMFKIDNGAFSFDSNFFNISAGSHTAYLKDSMNNMDSLVFTLLPGKTIGYSIKENKKISCFGESDGSFTIQANGGTAPYLYKLNSGNYSLDSVFTQQAVGNKQIFIKDSNNCETVQLFALTGPDKISAEFTQKDPTCFGAKNGFIKAIAIGGTKPYSYTWQTNPPVQSNILYGIDSGTVNLLIKDSNQCALNTSFYVYKNEVYNADTICAMTYDTVYNRRMMAWNVTIGTGIMKYRVYQYNSLVDTGTQTAELNVANATLFFDTMSISPNYYYAVRAVDSCGNQSVVNRRVKPIWLSASPSGQFVNLSWTEYPFMNDSTEIKLFRKIANQNWVLINDVTGLNSYTDTVSSNQNVQYFLQYLKTNNCFKNYRIFSNVSTILATSLQAETKSKSGFIVYPNPSNGLFEIKSLSPKSANYKMSVWGILGNLILEKEVNGSNSTFQLDLSNYADGTYRLLIECKDGKTENIPLIKMKD
ncbi:MAG: T9SS type A sorting domain-containing protein [Bacteroidia bacterium]